MNEHVKPPADFERVADQPPKRRPITADEFQRMGEAGIIGDDEHVELIAGEIVQMSPKGRFHEVLRTELTFHWAAMAARSAVKVASECPVRLTAHYEPTVDIMVFPASLVAPDVTAGEAILFVEVADTSEAWDLGPKASAYAAAGIREYWVINARSLDVRVFRDPSPAGYETMFKIPAGQVATPLLVPELAIRLTDVATPAPD